MSKPSAGAMRAAEKIWIELPDDQEIIASIIDTETGLPALVETAKAVCKDDPCWSGTPMGRLVDAVAKAEGREER